MTYRPKTAYIVSHTHWDREWYLTFHTFRVNLTGTVKRVLDSLENDPEFRHFLLDGQMLMLEDYLEVVPEDAERIRRHVGAGELSLGPWYILPDEFLISAESTVRNLFYGHKVASRFGGAQKAGYMPDSFGHIAQTPQILRQAGIGSFIYTRGNGNEIDDLGWEYKWRAPDGSAVTAINQCGGYCNASGLGFEEIWHAHTRRTVDLDRAVEQVGKLFDKLGERANGDTVLLNNGCDHFPPQQDFTKVIAALRKAYPETEFIHTSLEEYIKAVDEAGIAAKVHSSELLQGKLHYILSGVWSARMYLKQLNDKAQTHLSGMLEPLCAYTHFMHGREYPAGTIDYAWKLLLQNHPHDSICGCSIDEVHRDMLPRFDGVIQTAEQVTVRELEHLAPTFARDKKDDRETVLTVFNPLPMKRDAIIDRLVVLQPFGIDIKDLRLIDEQGNEVPFSIIDDWYVERFWGIDYRTGLDFEEQYDVFNNYLEAFNNRILKTIEDRDTADHFIWIRFKASDLPPVGHANYRLTDKHSIAQRAECDQLEQAEVGSLQNEYCRVNLNGNGTITIEDRISGRRFTGLNLLESTADIGDEYDYSECPGTRPLTSKAVKGEVYSFEPGGLYDELEAQFVFTLPESVDQKRDARSKELVDCPVTVRIRLENNSPIINIELIVDNQAKDHRLRALFPLGIKTDHVLSDGHFYTNERPVDTPDEPDWSQAPIPTRPQQDFSVLEDGQGGIALFNRGLPEIEAYRDKDGNTGLALTLLRSVGWLSRDDFPSRKGNAGPTIATPQAQCLGPNRYRFALVPYQGNWVDAGIKQLSQQWRTPVPVIQGVEDLSVPGGTGLVEAGSNKTCITAVKKSDGRDTLIVRLYNLTGGTVTEKLKLGREIKAAYINNLLEERGEAIPRRGDAPSDGPAWFDGHELSLELTAHRITTIEFELT